MRSRLCSIDACLILHTTVANDQFIFTSYIMVSYHHESFFHTIISVEIDTRYKCLHECLHEGFRDFIINGMILLSIILPIYSPTD